MRDELCGTSYYAGRVEPPSERLRMPTSPVLPCSSPQHGVSWAGKFSSVANTLPGCGRWRQEIQKKKMSRSFFTWSKSQFVSGYHGPRVRLSQSWYIDEAEDPRSTPPSPTWQAWRIRRRVVVQERVRHRPKTKGLLT